MARISGTAASDRTACKVPAEVHTIRVSFVKATAHEVRGCAALTASRDSGAAAHTDVIFFLLFITAIIVAVLCVRCVVQVYRSFWPAASCSSKHRQAGVGLNSTAAHGLVQAGDDDLTLTMHVCTKE